MFSSVFADGSISDARASKLLEHVVNHVFFLVHLPTGQHPKGDLALARTVHIAAHAYNEHIDHAHESHWLHIIKMLENLHVILSPIPQRRRGSEELDYVKQQDRTMSQLDGMKAGDMLVFPGYLTRVILRKLGDFTLYESFSWSRCHAGSMVESNRAFEIPNHVFDDGDFRSKLTVSLCDASGDSVLDMLREVGHPVEPKHITSHVSPSFISEDIHSRKDGYMRTNPSPCASLWLFMKFAIRSFLDSCPLGHAAYKSFVLFFLCNLANHAANARLSGLLLHSMSAKIIRRIGKPGSSWPSWLTDAASRTCTSLSEILDKRQQEVQATQSESFPLWDPSQLDFANDIQNFLPCIHEYMSTSLMSRINDPPRVAFFQSNRPRGTLDDFFSDPDSLLSRPHQFSHYDDIHVTLHDIELAVREDLDNWVAYVANVENACEQLEHLVYRYYSFSLDVYHYNRDTHDPSHLSIMLLTVIELWVALDKLVVKEIPMLADYSPEVPIDLLYRLLLHDTTSVHRLCRAYQYLFARHTRARPGWSVLSNQFTKDSFPCRYYDSFPHLHRLKACIEDTLPTEPLHAKIVVFELQRPISFDMWRSVTCWISGINIGRQRDKKDIFVCSIPVLEPHNLVNRGCSLSLYSGSSAPQCWDRLYYAYEGFTLGRFRYTYKLPTGPYEDSWLQHCISGTKHTSNEVLAAQANCNPSISLHEFTAFAHLRSGGSLQWFNILRELRSRTLDFRRQEVYLLLAQASTQVGPLDSAGQLLWHQELQDTSFCHSLLDELESLFVDVGTGSSDGVAMAIISLLSGVVTSNLFGDVSERAIKLLRKVRKKTFYWVCELLYEVRRSPTNASLQLLQDLAAICRSTFEGCTASRELLHSVQDIEISLSCAMLIRITILPPSDTPTYSQVLLDRDRRLSLILERTLRDAIQADTSNLGIDRAIQMIWPGYRPSPRRWEPLRPPNSRWFACETAPTSDQPSQVVHVNLLNGSLLVDSKPATTRLPRDVTDDPTYRKLFRDRNLMVVASDLPGMDFVAKSAVRKYDVHFGIRDKDCMSGLREDKRVVICAQKRETGEVFELIPEQVLEELPRSLTDGHLHWLNPSTSIVEIRQINDPWPGVQSSDKWTIDLQASGQSRIKKGDELLVDKQRPTWQMVSSRLQCLDTPENLIITLSPIDLTQPQSLRLSVTLPRYGLSFFINEVGHLESRDFKDMVYDENQCIGTLYGLANRLVLRSKSQLEEDLIPKLIIIPHCDFLGHNGGHISVRLPSSGHTSYLTYQADNDLGCMKGIVDLESRLYLARLHALTGRGGCRPDPLTGRTGVEEAISLMSLSGTRLEGTPEWGAPQNAQLRFALRKYWIPLAYAFDLHESSSWDVVATIKVPTGKGRLRSLDQLLHERPPPTNLLERNRLVHDNAECRNLSPPDITPLRQLFSSLKTNGPSPAFQSQYIAWLHSSTYHFHATGHTGATSDRDGSGEIGIETLRKHYAQCRVNYMESLDRIKMALGPKTEFERFLNQCDYWPRVTPFILFRCLASTSLIELPESWKKSLISLALLALDLQRARRLLRFVLDNLEEEFDKELENEGCDGWDAAEHPDWLLIQLQGDFLIRRFQADVAKALISPRSGKNTVMQVNMGEGKSSVIIPISAASLADGTQLARIVVPKPLIPQTLKFLTDRLCGLVNRRIYHLTFSRDDIDVEVDYQSKVKLLNKLVTKCRDERGIIVMQPEHVLSLKLACVEVCLPGGGIGTPVVPKWSFQDVLRVVGESLSNSPTKNTYVPTLIDRVEKSYRERETSKKLSHQRTKIRVAESQKAETLQALQMFFETHARDVLDECDDVLRCQSQLIYAIGHEYPFEGSPDRWIITQQVLGLVKQHAYLLSNHYSDAVQCHFDSAGSFPHIHILHENAGEQLISLVAQDVLDGRLSGLSFHPELGLRKAIHEFILHKDVHPATVKMVEQYAHQTTSWSSLLLLRGLLAYNILLFTLTQRRWRVDYGLTSTSRPRTTLAVPYRAKDVPAEAAEFGHPDITVLLTCLSYYYRGLDEEQLSTSFQLLLQQDNPSSEYALWLQGCGAAPVPKPLRNLSGVNIRSYEQWGTHLVPLFSRNKRTIDMYLSKVVFPKWAKEFPLRISCSSWDIAENKNNLVTGFSGTNDGQYLLPTSIAQDDPDHLHQTGTSAMVLAYLLQPENSSYIVTADTNSERWTTLQPLRAVVSRDSEVRVLLDVGAQILDFTNLEFAWAWLDLTSPSEIAGAIYFSEDDHLMVLTRDGAMQPLSSSPLAQQLHRCVAYLDDAHTRGTDIKFPPGFRAVVTLGPNVTKDRLVQGCMRMRKLGHGHSVMFLAPIEVDRKIRDLMDKGNQNVRVTTVDILRWAIHETWRDIQRQAPYWAQQGMSHKLRHDAWIRFCRNEVKPKGLADAWLQREVKPLADMYMPRHSPCSTPSAQLPRQIRDRCANLGVLSLSDVSVDEEQEREVSREIEREREVERPPWALPVEHSLHPDVIQFVRTGAIPSPSRSNAFRHVFVTGLPAASCSNAWTPYILVTTDFCETIRESEVVRGRANDYLRPVQWVLSGKMSGKDALVILSPFEVNQLMPEIRISERVHLHIYVPNTTKRMKPCNNLGLYSVPPLPSDWVPPWELIDQLSIFAGQLYLSDHASYVRLSHFLGIHTEDLPGKAGTVVARNWFNNPDSSEEEIKNRFEGTKLPLVMQLLAIRRGMSFAKTHMGRILEGWPLTEEDFPKNEPASGASNDSSA